MKETVLILQKTLMACELLAAFAGLFYFNKTKDFKTKAFYVYLMLIAAAEQLGWYLKTHKYKVETSNLYTYFAIPLEFVFAYWFIIRSSESLRLKKTGVVFIVTGLITNAVEVIFFRNDKFFFSSIAYITYNFFLVVLVLMFLFEFIRTEKIIRWWKEICFWVCSAFLIYYLTTFPLYAFYNTLYKNTPNFFYVYWEIQMFLNMLMYLLFFTGIVWTNREYK